MKDIPLFTTEHGVASLVLREIPYTAKAYIRIGSSLEPGLLLQECRDFCRAVGAEEIFATGDPAVEDYPFSGSILRMTCLRQNLPDTDAALFPVQEHTLPQWRALYNEKASKITNAAWMTDSDGKDMLAKGDGYFVHRGDTLLGIGRACGNEIRWVASCVPGGGEDVVKALANATTGEILCLEVASTNEKAMALYQRLGFTVTGEISSWYRIV